MSKEDERMIKINTFVDADSDVQREGTEGSSGLNPDLFAKKCSVSGPEDDAKGSQSNQFNELSRNGREEERVSNSNSCPEPVSKQSCEPKQDASNPEDASPPKTGKQSSKYFRPVVPKINCTERIIFCLDMSSVMDETPFKLGDGSSHSSLSMVKRTIQLYVENKHFINRKHEFSLMVLYENATWVREFTTDPKELIESLEDLNETQACTSCDLASIVQLLIEKYEMQIPRRLSLLPCVIRVVLVYARSNCMIHFSNDEAKDFLMNYPFLFLDIIYIHEHPSEANKSQEIFETLCDLDAQNKSYIFDIAHNTTKLHNSMAKLLAHPMQRAPQKNNSYLLRLPNLYEAMD